MKLAFHRSGSGQALVILHGLYGSSDNWQTIGRALSAHFEVYLVDQRNHGRSPHDPVHTYAKMSEDLHEFLDDHGIEKPILLGHSMGGKTAMLFALKYSEKTCRLVVVDISPADYGDQDHRQFPLTHQRIVSALQLINPTLVGSRKEADRLLQQSIPQSAVRQFLLKNLKPAKDGGYHWMLNLDALSNHMDSLAAGIINPETKGMVPISVPTLFIRGERSPYIMEDDISLINRIFSSAGIVTIPEAGHWVHAEQPSLFLKTLLEFLHPDIQP